MYVHYHALIRVHINVHMTCIYNDMYLHSYCTVYMYLAVKGVRRRTLNLHVVLRHGMSLRLLVHVPYQRIGHRVLSSLQQLQAGRVPARPCIVLSDLDCELRAAISLCASCVVGHLAGYS